MEYVGVLHIHSTYSDGALTVGQLAALARSEKLDFLVLSDHARSLTPQDIHAMAEACAAESDRSLLVLPGLEFSGEGRHVLVIGSAELLISLDGQTVVNAPELVRARGGITVWAHPALTFRASLRSARAAAYDGWEVWNRRVDGPLSALPVLKQLRRIRASGRSLAALPGLDFHRGPTLSGPRLVLEIPGPVGAATLLAAIREGRCAIHGQGPHAAGRQATNAYAGTLLAHARYGLVRMRCLMSLALNAMLTALGLRHADRGAGRERHGG